MRGADSYNESLFSTVRLEEFVPQTHPLRPIRTWVNEALSKMDAKFSAMYEADMRTDQVRYTLEYHFPHLCAADRCNGMAIRLLLKLRLPVWPSIFERYGEVFPSRTVPARLAFKQAIELSSASSHPPQ